MSSIFICPIYFISTYPMPVAHNPKLSPTIFPAVFRPKNVPEKYIPEILGLGDFPVKNHHQAYPNQVQQKQIYHPY